MIKIDVIINNYGSFGNPKRSKINIIQKIPDAVILHLFEFLDSKSVSRTAITCKNFSELAKDPIYLPSRRLNALKEREENLLLFLHKKQQGGFCLLFCGSVIAAYEAERSYMNATSHQPANRLQISNLCNENFISRIELINSSRRTYKNRTCLLISSTSIVYIWITCFIFFNMRSTYNYDPNQL